MWPILVHAPQCWQLRTRAWSELAEPGNSRLVSARREIPAADNLSSRTQRIKGAQTVAEIRDAADKQQRQRPGAYRERS